MRKVKDNSAKETVRILLRQEHKFLSIFDEWQKIYLRYFFVLYASI